MATIEESRAALERLAAHFSKNPDPPQLERSLSCRLPDLNTGFHATLRNGRLEGIEDGENEDAAITLTANSDDLVRLSKGELPFAKAWATGAVKLDASFMDMLKLRTLL